MDKIALPANVWTEVATGVSELTFNLNKKDNAREDTVFLVSYGDAEPDPIDFAALQLVVTGNRSQSVVFRNTAAQNIYVKPLSGEGEAVY